MGGPKQILRTGLEETVAKAGECVNGSKTEEGLSGVNVEAKHAMAALKLKVAAVQELQQREEKSIMEHDITRFNASHHNASEVTEGDVDNNHNFIAGLPTSVPTGECCFLSFLLVHRTSAIFANPELSLIFI